MVKKQPILWVYAIHLFLLAILAGGWLSNAIGDDKVERSLSAYSYAERQSLSNQVIGDYMPYLMSANVLIHILVLFLLWKSGEKQSPSFKLTLVGAALSIAIIVSTLIINVPVNEQSINWDPNNPPVNWQELRAIWFKGHTIRVTLAFPMLLAGIASALLFDRKRPT